MKDFQDKNTLASKPKPTGRHVIPYFNEIESRLKAAKTGQSILSSQYKRSNSSANENGLENMESLIQRVRQLFFQS
jgi:hypothetical protein